MVSESTVDQARQALTNLKYVLEEGGCTLKDVVKTTVLLTDINDFQAVNEVYSECKCCLIFILTQFRFFRRQQTCTSLLCSCWFAQEC